MHLRIALSNGTYQIVQLKRLKIFFLLMARYMYKIAFRFRLGFYTCSNLDNKWKIESTSAAVRVPNPFYATVIKHSIIIAKKNGMQSGEWILCEMVTFLMCTAHRAKQRKLLTMSRRHAWRQMSVVSSVKIYLTTLLHGSIIIVFYFSFMTWIIRFQLWNRRSPWRRGLFRSASWCQQNCIEAEGCN